MQSIEPRDIRITRPTRVAATLSAVLLGWLCAWPAAALAAPTPPLVLGVHPYAADSELRLRFAPLAQYLSVELGRPVRLSIAHDYRQHWQSLGSGNVDIALMGPVSYVRMVTEYGPRPTLARIERHGKPTLHGHIVVQRDSRLQQLDQLPGKTLGFGDPASTMGSLLPRAALAAQGIQLADLAGYRHYPGHSNVALAVMSGQVDAGAINLEAYESLAQLGLRPLHQLPPVSERLFVASSDLAADAVDQLRVLMLRLKDSPRGRSVLKSIHPSVTALVAVSDADYDSLRDLLEHLDDPEGDPGRD